MPSAPVRAPFKRKKRVRIVKTGRRKTFRTEMAAAGARLAGAYAKCNI